MGRYLYFDERPREGRRGVQFTSLLLQSAAECVHFGRSGAAAAAEGPLLAKNRLVWALIRALEDLVAALCGHFVVIWGRKPVRLNYA